MCRTSSGFAQKRKISATVHQALVSSWNLIRYERCLALQFTTNILSDDFFHSQIYGWNPHFYNKSSDLPELMPNDLQEIINKLDENDKKVITWLFRSFTLLLFYFTSLHHRPKWFGSHARVKIQQTLKTWGLSTTFRSEVSQATTIRSWTRRVTCHLSSLLILSARKVRKYKFQASVLQFFGFYFSRRSDQHWVQSLGSQYQSRSYRPKRFRSFRIDDWLSCVNRSTRLAKRSWYWDGNKLIWLRVIIERSNRLNNILFSQFKRDDAS